MAKRDDKMLSVAVDPRFIIVEPGEDLDDGRFVMEGIDASRVPLFNVSEVAKVFFARSPHWIRWRERSGQMVLDGEKVGTGRTEGGARCYTLNDIEKMAHALAKAGAIDGAQHRLAVDMVRIQARLWGYRD